MPIFPRYAGPPLLDQVVEIANLTSAWRRVRGNIQVARRGYSAGVDMVTLRDFEADWASQMARLAEELRSGTYRPLPARQVRIPKASGGDRAIAILTIRDRVAQRAVQQVLQPLFEPLFLDCSYGCRQFVGVPEAVARVARYADQGLAWAVDADIASYFDTIDQRILLSLLRQRIDEPALLQLISQWLQVGTLATGEAAPLETENPGVLGALRHGAQSLRAALDAPAPLPVAPAQPGDPYAAAAWDQPAGAWGMPQRPGVDSGLWSALMLIQPAIEGARRAVPLVQKVGLQRLAIGGALAVGAVAAGELALRAHAAGAARGAPQGGALSPLLANIYLHPFDLAMTSHGMRMVRFMDDLVVMCASQSEAEHALTLMRRQLAVLRLNLNDEKTRIVAYADGLEFLGQALAPRRSGSGIPGGLTSFAEAEQVLRNLSQQAGTQMRRSADQLRQGADRVQQQFQRQKPRRDDRQPMTSDQV